ncbi:phage tail fiber protein, partial [Escherichia coli]
GVNKTGNQSTTGNAATATKLQTARTIGGVSFDGSANIDLPGVNKTGNQSTTGNAATATKLQTARTINGVSFDGSANISLSPANIGCPASPTGWLVTGDNGASITTEQLVTLLRDNGAFNAKAWIARCAWAYANSASIPDSETGCGIIPLAGAVIEVFSHSATYYTIRITTATTTGVSGALTNAEFVYVFNGTSYSPRWRRAYNTKNKPTAADVGALPLSGGALTGGLTAAGEIISKSANGLRIAYGNYGFFIRNDGSNTYFMLTDSGNSLGTYNRLRPLIINNANGAVTIGNGLNVTGGINGSLNGNAATATKLQTARTINGVKFDGSANISIPTITSRGRVTALTSTTQGATTGLQMYEAYNNGYPSAYGNVLHLKGATAAGEGELFIGWSGTSGAHAPVHVRSRRDTDTASWSEWAQVYTSKDSIPGVNTTGNQNTTGNAASATKLQTARTIGGVSFDGTANINLPGVNIAGNQNTSGNAATATKLKTARKISGVAFDGSADITLTASHVGALPTTGGTVTGEIISSSQNAIRLTYNNNYGFLITNTGYSFQISTTGQNVNGDVVYTPLKIDGGDGRVELGRADGHVRVMGNLSAAGQITPGNYSNFNTKYQAKNTAYANIHGWHKDTSTKVMMQWGFITNLTPGSVVKFPTTFPEACAVVVISPHSGNAVNSILYTYNHSATGFTVKSSSTDKIYAQYVAYGY